MNSSANYLNTPVRKFAYLGLLAGIVFFLPYLVPVARTTSLSYVVGYSNRAALVIFTAGGLLFAYLTRENEPEQGAADVQPLSRGALLVGLAVVAATCVARRLTAQHPGLEAQYSLNRLQMLGSGLRPYRDFEYAYGPLHLYLPLLISHLTHCSLVRGYYLWWAFQWIAGAAMLWEILRDLDVPCRRWMPLYFALLTARLPDVLSEGIAYTPVRLIGAAFFLLIVWKVWRRTGSSFATMIAAVGSTVIELGISPEQGIGVAAGLCAWLLMLAWKKLYSWRAFCVFVAALLLLAGLSIRFGYLETLKSFAGGAYALPLVPSVPVALILLAYLAAFCVATRDALGDRVGSASLPMVLGGLALLPVAFGRCDQGHLQLASSAFLFGIASIESSPTLRRWWSPLALAYFVLLPAFFFLRAYMPPSVARRLHFHTQPSSPPGATEVRLPPQRPGGEPGGPLPLHAPCATVYRVVNVWPDYSGSALNNCIDTGYYIGDRNFFTDAAVDQRLNELSKHPDDSLLLRDVPLNLQITAFDTDPTVLRFFVRALYVPPARNQPFSYDAMLKYIEQHYVPASHPMGSYRAWYPKGQGKTH